MSSKIPEVTLQPHRRALFSAMGALALVGFGSQLPFAGKAKAADPQPMFMFVHTADGMKADAAKNSLRLINVSQQTLYFSDQRARRRAYVAPLLSRGMGKGSRPTSATTRRMRPFRSMRARRRMRTPWP